MLLRSASSPLLGCAAAAARVSAGAAAAENVGVVVMPASPVATRGQATTLCRASSEGDLIAASPFRAWRPPAALYAASSTSISVDEDVEEEEEEVLGTAVPLRRLLTSTGLDSVVEVEDAVGGGGGGGVRKKSGGGESGGAADAHYRRMIEADPTNPLLLGNYARFLREVEGDAARAAEVCERAVVANPGDADSLVLYAGLVWDTTRDAARADEYFSRAVRAAPDDCYVMGSYAGFLWDADEEEDNHDGEQLPPPLPPPLMGAAQTPSIRAAS